MKKWMNETLLAGSHIKFRDNIFDILRLWAILQVTIGHLQQHLQVRLPAAGDKRFLWISGRGSVVCNQWLSGNGIL